MEFQVLKQNHLKRNIIIGVVVVAIISAIVLNFTRAKYVYTDKMPLINGTVNYSLADLNIVAIYVGGVEVDSLDSSKQYTLDTEQSTCTYKDGSTIEGLNISYETETGSLSISPFTMKGTKCTLYFDEITGQTIQDILAGKTISTRSSFSSTLTTNTTGTIYQAQDDDGTTYYFAGAPTDNWVSFAGFYWRIIRINGDGSIRLIYSGDSESGPVTTGTDTQIGTSVFNDTSDDNMYVGYMYQSNQVHGLVEDSTIKGVLDNWYKTNIQDAGYSSYIDTNAGFCGDRSPSTSNSESNGSGGTNNLTTFYGSFIRLNKNWDHSNASPSFKCSDKSNDLFTLFSSNKGNKKLTYSVGLITADEIVYAGGSIDSTNYNYYLHTAEDYWTISPYIFNSNSSFILYCISNGALDGFPANEAYGIRPVINLRADTLFEAEGTGESSNPYVVI